MASDYSTPWALVDSADPGVQYSGKWLQVNGLVHIFVNYTTNTSTEIIYYDGPTPSEYLLQPFNNVSYHAKLNPENTLSYAFNGTGIAVFGSVGTEIFANTFPMPPVWQCFVDTIPITLPPNLTYFGQGDPLALCAIDSLEDGPHALSLLLSEPEITLFESVIHNTSSFYIDKIAYMPSLNPGDAMEVLPLAAIPSSNVQIQYGPGWELYQDSQLNDVHTTANSSASVTINFEGTSLAWFAQSKVQYDGVITTPAVTPNASYSIDGQDPVIFPAIPQSQANDITTCPILFNISQLAPGPHKLEVIFLGTSNPDSTYPLALTYVLIGNASHILSRNNVTGTSGTSSTSTGQGPTGGLNPPKSKTKQISFSVASVIILLVILIAGVFYLRRNKRRKTLTVHQFPMALIGHKDESEGSPNSTPISLGFQNQRKGPGPMDAPNTSTFMNQPPIKRLHALTTTATLQVATGRTTASINRASSTSAASPPSFSGVSPLMTEFPPDYTDS